MSTGFWIKRFLTVFALAFAVIGAAQLVKGHDVAYAATQAAIWSAVAAAIFTITRLFRARRGEHCAVCNDTPEMREDRLGEV